MKKNIIIIILSVLVLSLSGYIVYDSFEDAISGIRNNDGYEKLHLRDKTFNSVYCINKLKRFPFLQ